MAIQSQSFNDYLNARRAEVMGQFAQAQGQNPTTDQATVQSTLPQQPQGPTAQQSVAETVAQAMAEREQQQAQQARFRDNNHAGVRFLREATRYNQP